MFERERARIYKPHAEQTRVLCEKVKKKNKHQNNLFFLRERTLASERRAGGENKTSVSARDRAKLKPKTAKLQVLF